MYIYIYFQIMANDYFVAVCFISQSIFISRVTEDGPAGKAGIMKGDKLLKVCLFYSDDLSLLKLFYHCHYCC